MPLQIIIEPIVELVAEFVGSLIGESASHALSSRGKPYSDAYCKSFFCTRCPGMAKGKRVKLRWFLYRCQECKGRWGVLREKPWVRREKRLRPARA